MRKENNHRSELVSQLLYGDCFIVISQKKIGFKLLRLEMIIQVGLIINNIKLSLLKKQMT